MGSLIASHLVAALINATLGGIWGYVAAIEPVAPLAMSAVEPPDSPSLQRIPDPPRFASALRSLMLDDAQIRQLARDASAAEPSAGPLVPSAPVTRPLIGGAVHVELPRLAPDGRFVRPKIVIGLASSGMKNWLRAQGVAADHCMLPMLRPRARLNQQTREFSAGLTVYARCTFY